MDKKLESLAKGRYGKLLIEVLEEIKTKTADIRTPIKVRSEIQNEVRIGIIECLDTFLVEKLKILAGELEEPDPNEHN